MWIEMEKGLGSASGVIGGFLRDDSGVTAIEYALLGALIAVVIAAAVGFLGGVVNTTWTLVSSSLAAL